MKDRILELAGEAGGRIIIDKFRNPKEVLFGLNELEAFANLTREDERELCAEVCDDLWQIDGTHTAEQFAAAIRARGWK